MKNKVHYQEEGFTIHQILFGSLIFLTLYGTYKNGLSYVFQGILPLTSAFHPFFLCLSGCLSGLLIDYHIQKKPGKNTIFGFLISVSLPVQTPLIWAFLIIPLVLLILSKAKLSVHPVLCGHVLLSFFFSNGYLNQIEQQSPMFYGILDTVLGKSIGGVGITNLLLLILTYGFLCTRFYYKKEIPLLTISTYSIISVTIDIFTHNSSLILHVLNSSLYFVAIFLLPMNEYSPLEKKNQYIYAILTGILMYVVTFYGQSQEGPFLGAFFASCLLQIGKLLSKKTK